MKLNDYKPEIKFMTLVKNKTKNRVESFTYNTNDKDIMLVDLEFNKKDDYDVENLIVEDLPYTNCKDINGNKIYLFDVVKMEGRNYNYLVIYKKINSEQYVLIENKLFFINRSFTSLYNVKDCKRIGSIYELPEIQKEFNIEV